MQELQNKNQQILYCQNNEMLSPRKINLLSSPTKQNSKKDSKKSPIKNSYENLSAVIVKLLKILKKSGITISKQLGKQLPEEIGKLLKAEQLVNESSSSDNNNLVDKQNNINEQKKGLQIKCLQKKINDLNFQLKKQQEDSAQQILLLKLDQKKQIKRLKQKYAELETTYMSESKNIESKIEQIKVYYKQQTQKNKKQAEDKFEAICSQLKQKYQQQLIKWQQKLENNKNQYQQESQVKIQLLQQQKQQQIQQVKQIIIAKQLQKQDNHLKYLQQQQKIQKQWQKKRMQWQQQLKKQRNKSQDQIMQLNKQKQKLYTDLYLVRKDNASYKEQISKLNIEIKGLQKDIRQAEYKADEVEIKNRRQINKIQEMKQLQLDNMQKQYNDKLTKQLKNNLKSLQENRLKINELETFHTTSEELYIQKLQEIKQKFYSRPPRIEDTEKIQKYQNIVVRKNLQLKELKQKYVQVQMQTQNNQKNYNRIFSANPARRQSPNSQKAQNTSGRGMQKMFKQGNTVDLNFILKACNKNF